MSNSELCQISKRLLVISEMYKYQTQFLFGCTISIFLGLGAFFSFSFYITMNRDFWWIAGSAIFCLFSFISYRYGIFAYKRAYELVAQFERDIESDECN